MRGQPKRLSQNYLRGNGGNVIFYDLVSFHTRDIFCTLNRLFLRAGFRLFFCSFDVYCFAVCSVFGSEIKQTSTATATAQFDLLPVRCQTSLVKGRSKEDHTTTPLCKQTNFIRARWNRVCISKECLPQT